MALTSGVSHAASGLIGIFLSAYLSAHSGLFRDGTEYVGTTLHGVVSLPLDPTLTGLVAATTVLSFIWGVFYHLSRHE